MQYHHYLWEDASHLKCSYNDPHPHIPHIIIFMIFQLLNKMSMNHDMTLFGQSQELGYSPKSTIPIVNNIHHIFNKWNYEFWYIINRAQNRNRRWNRSRLWKPSRWWKWGTWCFAKTSTFPFRKWWRCWWQLTIWILGINTLPRRRDLTSRCHFCSRPCNFHFFLGSLGWYVSWWAKCRTTSLISSFIW